MPKVSRGPDELKEVKDRILEVAIKLINEMGFNNMSMRKLASKLGMTATNIYNYFSSKDELYLIIQTKGFNIMYDNFVDSCIGIKDPGLKLKNVLTEYLSFGIGSPNWYNIIFSMDTPKYADYRDKEIEPIAYLEKQAGLKLIDFTSNIVNELCQVKGLSEMNARFRTIQIWTQLHGIVSLYNSRVLQEVEEDTETIITMLVDDFIQNLEIK